MTTKYHTGIHVSIDRKYWALSVGREEMETCPELCGKGRHRLVAAERARLSHYGCQNRPYQSSDRWE
jgi:hypothetical protein